MKAAWVFASALLLASGSPSTALARVWTDSTGRYTLEADLVASNDRMIVLQRADHELGAFPLDKLSARDREFVKSQQTLEPAQKSATLIQMYDDSCPYQTNPRTIEGVRK